MALKFNVPPNWPTPPSPDWRPAPGWQPDPAWGPAPAGWNFWVEDDQANTDQPSQAEQADSTTPAKSTSTDSTAAEGTPEGDSPIGTPAGDAPAESTPPQTQLPGGENPVPPTVPLTPAANPYEAAPTVPLAPLATPSTTNGFEGNYAGSPNYYPAANYSPGTAPAPKSNKKLIFGIIGGILALLLILILALAFVLRGAFSDSSSSTSSSSRSSSSSSDALDAPKSSEYTTGGTADAPVYSGSGDQVIDIEKPGGKDSIVWLEYSFTGEDDFSSFYIKSLDAEAMANLSISEFEFGQELSGSYWLDTYLFEPEERTVALEIEAEGDWTITLRSADSAPLFKSGDTLKGDSNTAFRVEGKDAITVDATFTAKDKFGADLTVYASSKDDKSALMRTEQSKFKGNFEIPADTQYVSVQPYNGDWQLTAK
ncbi:MAG: hypothetical protein Q3965_00240 [Rothia sp. (in: high G+C Gram-positive bacteria)]|nr:hypothetical protein [Rothia sp. (in: high G+C Gram-positive bacteria)]